MDKGGRGQRTYEQEMIAPRIDASFHDSLRHGDGLGKGVVGDADVGGAAREVVEGGGGVGAQPGDGEGGAVCVVDVGVDEGGGEGVEEAGLAGAAGGDEEAEGGLGGGDGAVVGLGGGDGGNGGWGGGGVGGGGDGGHGFV